MMYIRELKQKFKKLGREKKEMMTDVRIFFVQSVLQSQSSFVPLEPPK